MSKSCINYSSVEWTTLLEIAGSSADAHLVYTLNGDVIPSADQAKVILDEYKSIIAKGDSTYVYNDNSLTSEEKIEAYDKILNVEQDNKKRMFFSTIEEAIQNKANLVVQLDGQNITPIRRVDSEDGLSVGFYFDVYHPELSTRVDVPLTKEEINYFFKNKEGVSLATRVIDGDVQYVSLLEAKRIINTLAASVFDTLDGMVVGEGLVRAVKSALNNEIELLQAAGKSTAALNFKNEYIDNYNQIVKAVVQKITKYQVAVEEIDDVDNVEENGSDLGDFDREILESSTFDKLDNEIKLYLSFITYIDPKTGKQELADEQQLYNALLKATVAYKNIPFLEKLERFGKYNPIINAFVTKYKSQMFDPDGNPLSNKARFVNKVNKVFEKTRLNETSILFFDSNIVVKESDVETSVIKQLKGASTEYIIRVKEQYSTEAGRNYIDKLYKEIENAISSQDADRIIKAFKNFLDEVGLPISEFYLNASFGMESDLSLTFTPIDKAAVDYIYNSITKEKNPFALNKEYDQESAKTKLNLRKILASNAMFDETVLEDMYTDANDKKRWSYAEENYLSRIAYNLQLEGFRDDLKTSEEGLTQHIFMRLRPEDANILFQNMHLTLSGSVKASSTSKGVTFKTIDDSSYLLQGLALLNSFETLKLNGKEIKMVKTLPKQWEAKSTAYNVAMPWNTTLDTKGELISTSGFFTLDDDFNFSLNNIGKVELARSLRHELARISQTAKEIRENRVDLVSGYHTGNKKGLKLFSFEFLSPELKKELEETAQQEGFDISNMDQSLLQRAMNEVSAKIAFDFGQFVGLLYSQGILVRTEEGGFIAPKISNKSISNFTSGFNAEEAVNTNEAAVLNLIAHYFINSTISSFRFNDLYVGNLASRIDFVDVTKRGGGELAFGPSAYREGYETAKVAYIEEPSRYVYIDNSRSAGKSDKEIQDVVNNLKALAKLNSDQSGLSEEQEFKNLLKQEGLKKIENADGQAWMSADRFTNIQESLGNLTEKGRRILEKVSLGIPLTYDETQYLTNKELIPNSVKGVYFNRNLYYKLSYMVLTKEFTSELKPEIQNEVDTLLIQSKGEYTDEIKQLYANEDNWISLPGKEILHNMRKSMVGKVDEVLPPSAAKIEKLVPASSETGEFEFDESNTNIIDNSYWRLQVKNPAGKLEITQGSQLLQLLDNEQNLDLEVIYKGQITNVRQLRVQYQSLLNKIRSSKFSRAESYMNSDGTLNKKLLKKLRNSLSAVNENNELLDFLTELEDGSPRFNLNIPHIKKNFEDLLIAHMLKKTLRLKLPGLKSAVISDYGYNVVRDVATGEVINKDRIKANRSQYLNDDGSLKEGYITDRLRFGQKTPSGNTLTEVCIPPYLAEMYKLKVGDNIPSELLEIFGIRIPTEDKRSMMTARVVEILPAHMGNSIMVPSERILYSGEDYDIDSIFIYRKEVYKDINGNVRAYGTYVTREEKFYEYLSYIKGTEEYKDAKKEFLESSDPLAEEYERLKKLEDQLIKERLGYNQVRNLQDRIKDIRTALNRIEEDIEGSSATMIVDEKLMYLLNIQALGARELLDKQSILANNAEVVERWKQIQQRKNEINLQIQDKLLDELDYPRTAEELNDYNSTFDTNIVEYELSNELLDIMFALYNNTAVQDIVRTPTDLSEMDDLASIFEDPSVKIKNSAIYQTPLGTYYSWKSNKDGKFNIGPVAKSNLTIAALTRNNLELEDEFGITIDQRYTNFGVDNEGDIILEKDENGNLVQVGTVVKRKFTSLANLLAAMTDNAKNQHANKLNLTYNTVGFAAAMLGLGMGKSRTMLFMNQPIVKEFSKLMDEMNDKVFNDKNVYPSQVITLLRNRLLDESGLTNDDYKALMSETLTTQDLIDNYNNKGGDVKTALLTLVELDKLANLTSPMITIGNILGLNKSLDDTSMVGLQKIIRSIRDLSLRDPKLLSVGEKQESSPNYYFEQRRRGLIQKVPGFKNFTNLFNIDVNTLQNVRRVEITNALIKPYLLDYDPMVDAILAGFVDGNLQRGSSKSNAFIDKEIEMRNFISLSLINRALNIGLGAKFGAINEEQIERELASLFPQLNNDQMQAVDIIALYKDVIARDPDMKNNPFLNILEFNEEGTMYTVTTNTFIKRTPEVSKLIKEGYQEVQRRHPELARQLKQYLKNTTGFDYTQGSFIGNLPATEFANLSSIITRLQKNTKDVDKLAKMVLYPNEYSVFESISTTENKIKYLSRILLRSYAFKNPFSLPAYDTDVTKNGMYYDFNLNNGEVSVIEFVNGKPLRYKLSNREALSNLFTGSIPNNLLLKLLSLGSSEKAYKAAVTRVITPSTKEVRFNSSEQSPYRFLHFSVNAPIPLVDNAGVEYKNVYAFMLGGLVVDIEDKQKIANTDNYKSALAVYTNIPNNKKFGPKDANFNELKSKLYLLAYNELFQSNPEFKELLLQTGNAKLTLESDLADDIKSLITSTINTLRAHYRTMPVIPQTKLYTPSLVKQNEDTYTVAEIPGLSFTRVDDKSFTISMVGIGSKVVNNEMFSEIKKMFNFGTSETPRYSKEVIALVIANRLGVNKDLVKNSLTLNFKTPQATPIQQLTETNKFTKKNLFTVTPQKGVSDEKAKAKASIATQYIGFGEGIIGKDGKRSTTQIYREQVGNLANTGNYSANDVIFVSIPGLRGDATIAKREQDKTIKEAIKAVEAGATILTDNKAYIDASSYNTGEKRLYANMEAKGYNYSEITVDGQVIGTWSKATQQSTTTTQRKTYSGKVTSLQPNQIFVFGSNPLGINGNPSKGTGGAALVAYNIAGVSQGEKMDNKLSDSGKAWGITTVTAPGKKRSKTPQEITEGIKKLYEYAKQNPTKEFLISDYSETNLNGYTGQEMADMFVNAGAIPSNIVFNENFDKLIGSTTQQPTTNLPGPETKINIYAGTGENAELSNFANRPFSETWDLTPIGMDFETLTFNTVEGAFQASKILYSTNLKNYDLLPQFQKASGVEARALGKQVKELDTKTWDASSPTVMKNLLKQSFEQNPDALAKLLATGNATLTHTQDKTRWGTEFPKLLMEVRDELRGTQPTVQSNQINFQENQTGGYPARTRINASADATIHLAINFETPGEKLTKKSVNEQGKTYIALNASSLEITPERINKLVNILNSNNVKTLNIAGNGIYDMKQYTQEQVDEFTYQLLQGALNSPNLKNKITSIRSGGQTGFDEAGAKAGIKLGIPTTVLAPKDWEFRTNEGNVKNEQAFKARFDNLKPTTQQATTTKTVSEAYGVVTTETTPSAEKTQQFVDVIQPQIQAQAYKENASGTANDMFMYGLRWTRKSTSKQPLINKSYANKGLPTNDAKAKDPYVYDTLDQNGNPLAPVSDLQPIIAEIEKSLGIDMSNYDAVIGNIYLPGQNIATHRDTTESLSARNYPVVVYTIGNDSGINVYENEKNPGAPSFASDKKVEIKTTNGTIYTFGMDGKGRFEVAHDTPKNIKRDQKFPPITLPNGTVVENYTITLTFRRAADLEAGMPTTPNKITTTQQVTTIKPGVQEVFDSNPELASIGTAEQYSAYLDTIFPDSQVKDIVYHLSNAEFEKFDKKFISTNTRDFDSWLGFFFTTDKIKFKKLLESRNLEWKQEYPAILNIKKIVNEPGILSTKFKDVTGLTEKSEAYRNYKKSLLADNYDGIISPSTTGAENITVFEPEQIHILGNKQDVEGFKEFVSKKDEDDNNTPPSCGLSNF